MMKPITTKGTWIILALIGLLSVHLSGQQTRTEPERTNVWLYEGFDHEIFPPDGWSRFNLHGPNRQWVRHTGFTYNGAGTAFHHYHATEFQEGWLVTPLVALGQNSALRFYHFTLNPEWYVYSGIWLSTGSPDPTQGDFVELTEISNGSMNWEEYTLPLNGYDGQGVYLAFVYNGLDAHSWYIDDVYIYSISGLPGPAISGIPADGSHGVLVTTALSWEQASVGPLPTGFKISLGTDNPPTNIEFQSDLGNVNIFTPANPLDFATTYYWQVIPYNATGDSPDTPVWSFTTGPDPTLTAPYLENFDQLTAPQLPYMWHRIVTHTSTVAQVRTTASHTPHSLPLHIEIYNTFTADPNGLLMFISPPVSITEGHKISFYAKASHQGALLVTGSMTDPLNTATFVAMDTFNLTTAYQEYAVSLNGYEGHFVFMHGESAAGNGHRILIDDFAYFLDVPYPSPAMTLNPPDGAVEVLPYAMLEWMPGPGAFPDGYHLHFGTDFPPTNITYNLDLGQATSYAPDMVMEPHTTHYWQIIPYNAEGEPGNTPVWMFTTGADPTLVAPHYETFDDLVAPNLPYGWEKIVIHGNIFANVGTTHQYDPYSHPYHAELFNTFITDPGQPHLMLITPEVMQFYGHQVRFFAKASMAGTQLQVGAMDDPADPHNFVVKEQIGLSTSYEEYVVDLSSFEESGSRIAFRHGAPGDGGGLRIVIDDFAYESLGYPTQVALAAPPDQHIVYVEEEMYAIAFEWFAVQPDVEVYQLDVAVQPDFSGLFFTNESISDTIFSLEGLQANQTYFWRVRALNNVGWGPFSQTWAFSSLLVGLPEQATSPVSVWNRPNPFSGQTEIVVRLENNSRLHIEIIDIHGKRVSKIFEGFAYAGKQLFQWQAKGVNAGMYFVVVKVDGLQSISGSQNMVVPIIFEGR